MTMLATLLAILTITTASATTQPANIPNQDEAKWKAKLSKDDRAAVDAAVGFSPPEFPETAKWFGKNPGSFDSLRGKVVLVQTFNTRNTLGRGTVKKVERAMEKYQGNSDLAIVFIHTPDGATKADRYLERAKIGHPVMIDPEGTICDQLGAYKRPVNYLVDRSGNIRFAGLTDQGAAEAVKKLLSEQFDPTVPANTRPEPETPDAGVDFPVFNDKLGSSADLRGRKAPNFFVERWITREPNARGKVAVVDFWATWCGPCVAAIPHMNQLQREFASDVVCVGISDESRSKFLDGLKKRDLDDDDFAYSLALDTSGSMKSAFQIRGIPHVAVISSDWVVRWQGHPSSLSTSVMRSIVNANRALQASSAPIRQKGMPPARWKRSG